MLAFEMNVPRLLVSFWVYMALLFSCGSSLLVQAFVALLIFFSVVGSGLILRCFAFVLLNLLFFILLIQNWSEGPERLGWSSVFLMMAWVVGSLQLNLYSSVLNENRIGVGLCIFGIALLGMLNGQSQFLAEQGILLIELMIFVIILKLVGWKIFINRKSWIIVMLFMVSLMLFSNFMASVETTALASMSRVWVMLGHALFAWAIFEWSRQDELVSEYIIWGVALSTLAIVITFLAMWFGGYNPTGYGWTLSPPLFNNIRHMGYFLSVAGVSAFVFYFFGSRYLLFPVSVFYLMSASLLLWNGGRGAIIAVLLTSVVVSFLFPFSKKVREYISLICMFMTSLCVSYLFRVDEMGVGWLSSILRSGRSDNLNRLSSGRLEIWREVLPFVQERFWFGWGGEGFRSIWPRHATISAVQPHNGILQMLLEWGAAFTIPFFGLIFLLISSGLTFAFEKKRKPELGLILGLSIALCLVTLSMFDGVFYYGTPAAFLALSLGLIFSRIQRVRVDISF